MAKEYDIEKTSKIFPEYFNRFTLPEGAHEESITVYRACKNGKCDENSFIPSFEENGCVINPMADPEDPGQYSLSTYEKPKDVKRFAGVMYDIEEPCKIAVGKTEPVYGLVQRTKERTKRNTSHVDWWLYDGAKPHNAFELIEDFDDYMKQYAVKRENRNENIY